MSNPSPDRQANRPAQLNGAAMTAAASDVTVADPNAGLTGSGFVDAEPADLAANRLVAALAKLWRDAWLLFKSHLLDMRNSLHWVVAFGALFPLGVVFGYGSVARGAGPGSEQALLWVIAGSAVTSVVTLGLNATGQELGWQKSVGVLVYWFSLPISRAAFIGALVSSRLLMNLPGVAVTLLLGPVIFDLPINPHPLLIVVVMLATLSLVGVGALIGLRSPSQQVASLLSQGVLFFVMFASPVLVPMERLPRPLQLVGYLFPSTYAAEATRLTLMGVLNGVLWRDLAILSAWVLASFALIARGLSLRLD